MEDREIKIAFLTDTAAYITEDLEQRLNEGKYDEKRNLFTVPLNIVFNEDGELGSLKVKSEESMTESEVIEMGASVEDLLNYMDNCKQIPTTSQPTPAQFQEIYTKIKDLGYTHVVGIFVSSKLSGTWANAISEHSLISGMEYWIPELNGFSVLNTIILEEAIKEQSLEDIQRTVSMANSHVKGYLTVKNFSYLHKSGRVSGAARWIADGLSIKPILESKEGKLTLTVHIPRTVTKAVEMITELFIQEGLDHLRYVIHVGLEKNAKNLAEALGNVQYGEIFNAPIIALGGRLVAAAGIPKDYQQSEYTELDRKLLKPA